MHETLFPYGRRQLQSFLESHWQDAAVRADVEGLRQQYQIDKSQPEPPTLWKEGPETVEQSSAVAYANWLIERDSKCTPLKSLQGKIWQEGYARGDLKSEVFADVPPAFVRWIRQRKTISIFSSGSVLAQRLLFAHTSRGNLTSSIYKYFDTTTGRKTASESYRKIARALDVPAATILFVSDVVAELDAANHAYMQTVLCVRGEDAAEKSNHKVIKSFDEIVFQ